MGLRKWFSPARREQAPPSVSLVSLPDLPDATPRAADAAPDEAFAQAPGETMSHHGAADDHGVAPAASIDEAQAGDAPAHSESGDPDAAQLADAAEMTRWVEDAILSRDTDEAVRRCLVVEELFPHRSFALAAHAQVLSSAGRHDEAHAMLATALERFPDSIDLLVTSLTLALARRDGAAARRAHDRLLELYPEHPFTLTKLPRFTDRIEQLVEAERRRALRATALEAQRHARWREAEAAWRELDTPEGADRDVLTGLARAVREGSDHAEAERLAQRLLAHFPDDAEARANAAMVAMQNEAWPEAVARWEDFVRVAPGIVAFDRMIATAHARNGASETAETMMERALARDPDNVELRASHAQIAEIAGSWDEAVRRWDAVIALRPGVAPFVTARGQAIWHRDLDHAETAGDHAELSDIGAAGAPDDSAAPIARQILDFESFGDNCEFGLVQRHHGVEPIGLMRFAAVQPGMLLDLLDAEFEPLGDPAHIVVDEKDGEYIVRDDRGYYEMHSFIPITQVGPERYMRQQLARIALLKRKLMTQLRDGGRIYVCKDSYREISDETLQELSRRLRQYGDNLVLGIRPATEAAPPGHVELIDENIMVGHLQWMFGGNDSSSARRRIDQDSWARIVPAAHAQLAARRELRSITREMARA